ncbi:MAG: 2-polyprenylphenol 6-hydroxylase, partial [Pseudomonadota bacterium]
DYIRNYLGPQAVIRDLSRTVQALSRFGPQLPQIVENLLEQGLEKSDPPTVRRFGRRRAVLWALAGAALASLGWGLGLLL